MECILVYIGTCLVLSALVSVDIFRSSIWHEPRMNRTTFICQSSNWEYFRSFFGTPPPPPEGKFLNLPVTNLACDVAFFICFSNVLEAEINSELVKRLTSPRFLFRKTIWLSLHLKNLYWKSSWTATLAWIWQSCRSVYLNLCISVISYFHHLIFWCYHLPSDDPNIYPCQNNESNSFDKVKQAVPPENYL